MTQNGCKQRTYMDSKPTACVSAVKQVVQHQMVRLFKISFANISVIDRIPCRHQMVINIAKLSLFIRCKSVFLPNNNIR